jgi:hypothetical protein
MAAIDPSRLAFDVDGVVADTMTLFVDIARDEHRIEGLRTEDITCYALEECIGWVSPEVIQAVIGRILEGGYEATLRPIAGASEVLTRIGRHSGGVLFVTARPFCGPICDWIRALLPLAPEAIDIVATGAFEAKAQVLQQRGITHFVEDRLETCFDLQRCGITPILFRQPWNRQPHPFTEVASWRELAALIDCGP